jgi:hypothetical protein
MGMMRRCSTCGNVVFHLWEHPVPPVGTARSTCGNINHGYTMDSPRNPWMERSSTSPCRGSSLSLLDRRAEAVLAHCGVMVWASRRDILEPRLMRPPRISSPLGLNRSAGLRILNPRPTRRRTPPWRA